MKVIKDPRINHTGIGMSSLQAEREIEGALAVPPSSKGNASFLVHHRKAHIQDAEGVGTVPVSTSIKGLYAHGAQEFKGKNLEIFLDKLGEQLAYERFEVRLYDALIGKLTAKKSSHSRLLKETIHKLKTFRRTKLVHFFLIHHCLEEIGADPSSLTPSADVSGMMTYGLLQIITEPRTTFIQSLQAAFAAELSDHENWKLLLELAHAMDFKEMTNAFQTAKTEEQSHLDYIRNLYCNLILDEAKVAA